MVARLGAAGGFQVRIDPAHGGRWTSLIDPDGREWLWRRVDPTGAIIRARHRARPGQEFVDAGGVEECFPTITGSPDHGDVWARPWTVAGNAGGNNVLTVSSGDFELTRRVEVGDHIGVDYQLTGRPAARFIWAWHGLLTPQPGTRIQAPAARCRAWPEPSAFVESTWPTVLGRPGCDVFGTDDGSAAFCVLVDVSSVTIESTGAMLRFDFTCPDQPVSFGIWRNLGGFPDDGSPRYRSLGVEPMLGRAPSLAHAGPTDAAVLPPSGVLTWRLAISAEAGLPSPAATYWRSP